MSKAIVPIHLADLTATPTSVASGFKKFYLKNGELKLYDGIEKDVVLDRLLDNFTPLTGTITSADSVLTAIEKLYNAVGLVTIPAWGNITGTITDQIDLISYLVANYYPLSSNPAGYLTVETDPIFTAWLATNPLAPYLLSSVAATTYYPLSSNPAGYLNSAAANALYYPLSTNPAGYLTQDQVVEYLNFAALPSPGTVGILYVVTNADTTNVPVYYIWNGSAYVTTTQPVTGVTGSGITNYVPKWTSPTSIGNSNIYNDPTGVTKFNGIGAVLSGNTLASFQRGQAQIDLVIGNPGIGQPNTIWSSNTVGLELKSKAYTSLQVGASYIEALRLLATGQINITQTPATGTTSDLVLLRDSSGNLKQISVVGLGSGTYLPLAGGTMSGAIVQPIFPIGAFDVPNKTYIDNLITGITWKNAVRVATTVNITLSGTQTIDGVAVVAGNRVLVKNQTFTTQNGIYTVAAGAWVRAVDADTPTELEESTVLVTLGTINKNTQWTQSFVITTIGTDPVNYVQIAGAGVYTNGTGITLTGNVFSISNLAITNALINDLAWSKITGTPTTLAGYAITDAYPLTGNPSGFLTSLGIGTLTQAWDADLDAIAVLSGTSGFLKKVAANSWTLDTNTYLTSLGIGSLTQAWDADLDAIAALAGTSGFLKKTGANTWTLDTSTYLTSITSGNVTTALGFTPENVANKATSFGTLNNTLYPTTQAVQTLVDTKQIKTQRMALSSPYTLANSTSPQKLFNVGASSAGTFLAAASTTYEFRMFVDISALSSSAQALTFSLGGTATYTSMRLKIVGTKAALLTGSTFIGVMTSASGVNTTTSNANTVATIEVFGIIRVNGVGTIIPMVTTAVGAASSQVEANSHCSMIEVGTNTFTADSQYN
jgi:hypothetical protein